MPTRSRDRADRPSHPPLWLVEGLDIVSRKWVLLAVVTAVVLVLGAIVAMVLPQVVPPTPAVGAAIGLAGLLLGLAAAVASDATDLVVRGPRHVAAAGGELVAVLPRDPSVAAAGPLASAVLEVREPGVPLLLAFATASRDARRSSAWTDAIARSLVAEGVGVLRVDLASGRSEHPGLVEVVRDGTRLADAVTFEPGVKLAQLSAGRDHADALAALTELPGRLPRDLDIMLVSLPTAASRSVVAAAAALDHVLIIVERDRTSRVDLIASLDALEAAGTHAQVVLLDTSTAMRLAPPVELDPEAEAERRRTISSTVGTSPVVVLGSDGEPVPVAEDESASVTEDELSPEDVAAEAGAGGDEDAAADEASLEDEEPPPDEVAAPDAEEPAEAAGDEEDREGSPLVGPLAAGVAGAGVAAGLGAVAPAPEEVAEGEAEEVAEGEAEDAAEDEAAAPTGGPGPEDDSEDDVDGATAAAAVDPQPEGEVAEVPATTEPEASELTSAREAVDEPIDEPIAAADDSTDDPIATVPELDAAPAADLDTPDEPGAQDEDEPGAQDELEPTGEGGAEQRDLELLEAAAAATAMSIATAEQEPFDPAFEEDAEPHGLEDELPKPGDPLVEELIELPMEEGPAAEAAEVVEESPAEVAEEDEEDEEDDPTDRLAPVQVSDSPMLAPFESADQDLLRTTAQLAVLSDDLAVRGRAEAEAEERPGSGSEDADDAGRDDRA